jgi:hypothetical protein
MDENIVNTIQDSASNAVTQNMDGNSQDQTQQQVNPAQIRKSTQQSMLKAASNATGMEFQSMEELLSTMARMNQQIQQLQGSQQQTQHQPQNDAQDTKKGRVSGNDLQDQILAMKQEMELKEKRLREKELDGSIRNAMGDKFDTELTDYAMSKIKDSLVEQDGEWVVVDSKNRQRYTQDGNPMTVNDLIAELGRQNPKLLKQAPAQGGSGLRPQSGVFDGNPGDGEFVPDYTRDPAAFNAWAQKRGLGKNSGLKGMTAAVYNSTNVRKMF